MNGKRKLTIVMTQLFCGLLLLCSGASAQQTLIDFDDVPHGTVINTRYAGVTFSKIPPNLITVDPNIYANNSWEAPSSLRRL